MIDRLALGRRLSALTNADVAEVLDRRGAEPLLAPPGPHRVGFTGPPGAGKSTLIGVLARRRLARGRRLGVVCVDPTSPTSGGSILGDRIRIDGVVDRPGGPDRGGGEGDLYVRSVPSRASEDGLSDNLPDLLSALDAQPFDEVWLETVGVGQAAFGVRRCVDTVVVLVLPGAGDTVQAMKAGILEIGDIYVVSKGDRPGADQMAAELGATLAPAAPAARWRPPVIVVSAEDGRGLDQLDDAIDAHRLVVDADRERRSADRARYDVERLLHRRVHELVAAIDPTVVDLAGAYRSVINALESEKP